MIFENKIFNSLEYVEAYREDFDKTKKHPLFIHFHGSGTRNTSLDVVKKNELFDGVEKSGYDFVTVAPLCRYDSWFDCFETVRAFIVDLSKRDYIDEDRIYLLGTSMGAYCAWQLAMSMPEYFAALAPICGGGMYWNAKRLINIPVWAFHGELDRVVFPEESKKLVDAINKKGGNAKLTLYPDCQHAAWEPTFRNPELYSWLISNSRKKKDTASDDFNDAKKFG